ncbi:excinuclease ABC subunit UvrB [Candidatus Microgenomates bacterium]|nr:excinuclease ABC subunit UvrB [Candidatus Microgenomates bacterium]
MNFKLAAPFKPTGDQPQAIEKLREGLKTGVKNQVLLGVTGSGKTFTLANVIQKIQRPTLVISHNKTLAAQLYQEFRDFFPNNAVSYFVSYYDYYQPEAYIPRTDTYIEKETEINDEIDKLRLAATTNLLTRKDTIIVSSVSCIYNIGSPKVYGKFVLEIAQGAKISRESVIRRLVDLQYTNNPLDFRRGTFRIRGETIDLYPAYEDIGIRLTFDGERIVSINKIDPLEAKIVEKLDRTVIYPAKHYMTDPEKFEKVFQDIRRDLQIQKNKLLSEGKEFEARRLNQKVNYDLEMIQEIGYVNGIENYSRYFDGRRPGEPPYTLFDYFREPYGDDWLLIIDESHMTIPQIRGMYNGDFSRKNTLIDFGFRLPSALDNRPLTFREFLNKVPQTIYVSATPDEWELSLAKTSVGNHVIARSEATRQSRTGLLLRQPADRNDYNGIVEQLVRPTGIIDPEIFVRPTEGQITDLVREVEKRKEKGERVLVTTITKRMAEDLAEFLQKKKSLKVQYLHSDIQTLERSDILDDLRNGKYDVLVGINLLREGLDLPEVSLVAILDADKEGFLRSTTSLVQTMGRAARHTRGTVIMYADRETASMKRAIDEINRRRIYQQSYNKKHKITPKQITKPVRDKLTTREKLADDTSVNFLNNQKRIEYREILAYDYDSLTPGDLVKLIKKMETNMRKAAGDLNFELAIEIRDKIRELKERKL